MAELLIDIKLDPSGELKIKRLKQSTDELETSTKKATVANKGFNTSMVAATAGALALGAATQKLVKIGFDYNRQIENATNGITALTVATSSNVSAQGKALTIQEKYTLATKEAVKTMKELEAINASTPHTLSQTNEIYKAMYVSMKNAGATSKDMVQLTKQISIAAGAAGIQFQSLLAGVDGLATGTVLANSDLGRFLGSLGLTNKVLKESDNVTELLIKRLSGFKAIPTYDIAFSNLKNSIDRALGESTQGIFKDTIVLFNDLSKTINDNKDDIVEFSRDFIRAIDAIGTAFAIGFQNNGLIFDKFLLKINQAIDEYLPDFISETLNLKDSIKELSSEVKIGEIQQKLLIDSFKKTTDAILEDTVATEKYIGKIEEEGDMISRLINSKTVQNTLIAEEKDNTSDLAEEMAKLNEEYQKSLELQEDIFITKSKGMSQASDDFNEAEIEKIQKALDLIEEPADRINNQFLTIYDTISEIFNQDQLEKFFETWNDELKKVEKTQSKYEGIGSADWASGLSGQVKDIANIGNAFADLAKEQKTWAKYSEENAVNEEDTNTHLQNQIGLYGNIAGAVANMAEEGSAAAKVAQVAQTALAVAQGVSAILNQGSGDPYTAIPRMIAMAAMVASTISSLGGGSASVSSSTASVSETNISSIEDASKPVLDRLDRQIELLELIGLEGTAGNTRITMLDQQFGRDYSITVEEILRDYAKRTTGLVSASQAQIIEDRLSFNLFGTGEKGLVYDHSALREGYNFLEYMASLAGDFSNTNLLAEGKPNTISLEEWQESKFALVYNEFMDDTSSFVLGLIEEINNLADSAETLEDAFDSITGTTTYAGQRLSNAFKDINTFTTKSELPSYLQGVISDIRGLEEVLNADDLRVILEENPQEVMQQIALMESLQEATVKVFENGAEEALNYLDSIELISEALEASRENIESFVSSFMDEEQEALYLANKLGVDLATSFEELATLAGTLSEGVDGLTDSELELLEANKDLIDSDLDDYLETIADDISTLESVVSSLSSVIDKLKNAAGDSEYSLQKYYKSMKETLSLSGSSDVASFQESLSDTISASSALFDTSNFTNSRDQQFAQLVAASQFESMEDTALEQIDYLEMIEENTREQIAAILLVVQALGDKIDDALLKTITGSDSISSAYNTILGRDADDAGASYWANEISSGNISSSQIGIAVGTAGVANNEISRADYVSSLYTEGLGRTPTAEEVNYWSNESVTPTTELASLFSQLDPDFKSFAVGTQNVPYDMTANIHKGEMIIPKTFSDGIRSGDINIGNNLALEKKLDILIAQNQEIISINSEVESNTRESRIA